jgi:uncharacterized membrane protein YgcG
VSTSVAADRPVESPAVARVRPPWAGRLRSGRLPVALLAVGTVAVLRFYGVAPGTTAVFAAYVVLGVVLPGTLVWRALHRGEGLFAADVAAGTALGYAGETLTYIPARAVGLPLLVLAWPVGVVLTFALVPRLRRHWRGRGVERVPALWSWSLTAAVAAVLLWSCKFFRGYGLSGAYYTAPDTDSPFHLALIGEAKHHMPMTTPWVAGEPLYYHWFAYAEMAATSWVTGIEPQVLLLRLSMLPMLAAFVVLVAVLAGRLFGHWWTGVAAVVVTLFVLAPNPYGWPLADFYTGLGFSAVDDASVLRLTAWTGPTQTFGALLFAALMLLLVDLFRAPLPSRWVAFAVLACAVMGAKATYLPLLLVGLAAVLSVHAAVHRRLHVAALGAAAITLACLLFAQFVLFGGQTQGLAWRPLTDIATAGIGTTGILGGAGWARLGLVTALAVWCWVCIWAGLSGIVRYRTIEDAGPAVVLLLAIGAGGLGATMLLGQDGDSQRFFFESARPYLAVAAVGGLSLVLRPGGRPLERLDRRTAALLAAAALTGLVVVLAIRHLDGPAVPKGPVRSLAVSVGWPHALTALVALAAAVALALARRRVSVLRGLSHALLIALLAGFGLSGTVTNFGRLVHEASSAGWRHATPRDPIVTPGTLEAGRWLRDHSDPNDIVATNAHCLPPAGPRCVNLRFAVAAYTERRVLVEGWGFTATAHERAAALHTWVGWVPFWRPDVLAANDEVFTRPTAAAVARLRDRYGVRWLFVDALSGGDGSRPGGGSSGSLSGGDGSRPGGGSSGSLSGGDRSGPRGDRLVPVGGLDAVAVQRFRSGDCTVYEILRPGEAA